MPLRGRETAPVYSQREKHSQQFTSALWVAKRPDRGSSNGKALASSGRQSVTEDFIFAEQVKRHTHIRRPQTDYEK